MNSNNSSLKNILYANIERLVFLLSSALNILFFPVLFGIEMYGDYGYLNAVYSTAGGIIFLSIREYLISKYNIYNSKIRLALISVMLLLSALIYLICILFFNNLVYLNHLLPVLLLMLFFKFIQIYKWENELEVNLVLLSKATILNTLIFLVVKVVLVFYIKEPILVIYSIYLEYFIQFIIILIINKKRFFKDLKSIQSFDRRLFFVVFKDNLSLYFLMFIILLSLKFEVFFLKPVLKISEYGEYALANKIIEVFNFIPMLILSISYSKMLSSDKPIFSSEFYKKSIALLSLFSFSMCPALVLISIVISGLNDFDYLNSPYSYLMIFYAFTYPIKIFILIILRHYIQTQQLTVYIRYFFISSIIQISTLVLLFDTFEVYTIIISNLLHLISIGVIGYIYLKDFRRIANDFYSLRNISFLKNYIKQHAYSDIRKWL